MSGTLVLLVSVCASAAPTTSNGSDDDAETGRRAARPANGTGAEAPSGESRTMQMLLDLQSSRAPLEGGERVRVGTPGATQPPAPAPKPAPAPAQAAPAPAAPAVNPFSRALEMGRPATTRELRAPTVATPAGDAANRPVASGDGGSVGRGERYAEVAGPGAEDALREKIGGRIPMPVAVMRYIRENRATVLTLSLVSLCLVGWLGARATQRRG